MPTKRSTKGLSGDQSAEESLRRVSEEGGSGAPNMAAAALSDFLARRKNTKFSYEENTALVRGVVCNKEALYGPLSETLFHQHKKEIWGQIAAAVNAAGSLQRTEDQCKKRLERMMRRIRHMIDVHAKPSWTPWDGLPFSLHLLTDFEAELMITLMMGPRAVERLEAEPPSSQSSQTVATVCVTSLKEEEEEDDDTSLFSSGGTQNLEHKETDSELLLAPQSSGETLIQEQQEEVYEIIPHPHASSAKEAVTSASASTSCCPAAELSLVIPAPVVQPTPPPPAADLTPKAPSVIMDKRSTLTRQGQLYRRAKQRMLSLIHEDLITIHQTQIQDYKARLQYYQNQIGHHRRVEEIKRRNASYERQQFYLLQRFLQHASPLRRSTSSETAAIETQMETQAARASGGDGHVSRRGLPKGRRGRVRRRSQM